MVPRYLDYWVREGLQEGSEFQDITKINPALVDNSMMGHQTALKPLDEEWARHSENVGSPLARNRLIVRNQRDGLTVGDELHCRSEDFDHGGIVEVMAIHATCRIRRLGP
jgi:hypothetical protein